MANPAVVVDFLADTSKLTAEFQQASAGASGFGSKLKGMAKAGVAAAGVAGIGAVVATLKIGISEYSEASKVAAQTNAVIKSTGQAAGVSAKDVSDLAESIMQKSGIDDEAIASGEKLLLTFTNLRNEAGAGNDIFNQTTQIMADMATAMGTTPQKTAIQLGKALNDPVKGITALSKVGVSFTEGQKKQIKAMVESGNTIGAQKLILAELNKEFGGSAEAAGKTLPGMLKIAKESFNNFAGELVAKMVPALTATIGWLRDHWPEITAALQSFWASVQPILVQLGVLIASVAGFIKANWGTIGPIVAGVAGYFQAAASIITGVLKLISAIIRGDWSAAWEAFKQIVQGAVDLVENQIRTAFAVYKAIIDAAWALILAAVTPAWNAIKGAVMAVVDAIKTALKTAWDAMKTAIVTAIEATEKAVKTAWDAIKTAVTTVVNPIKTAVKDVAEAFEKPASAAKTMLGGIKSAFGAIEGVINAVVGAVKKAAQAVADAITKPINAAKEVVNAILGKFNALSIPGFNVTIPGPGPIPDVKFGWGGMELPDIPLLAKGAVVSRPTLAMVGEGAGREIVAPESLLRSIMGDQRVEVRVFIGSQELTHLVRTEIVDAQTGLARSLLAGGAA